MNSKLYNNIIILPDSLIKHLEVCFGSVGGDTNTEGWKRNQELRQTKQVTYQQLKRMKNWFDGYGGNKEDAPFILNGGDRMNNWCKHALDHMRNSVDSSKKTKSDVGMQNQYLKSHEKNSFNLNDKHTTTVDNLKVESFNKEVDIINKLIRKII
jgi:hypothetical protein